MLLFSGLSLWGPAGVFLSGTLLSVAERSESMAKALTVLDPRP
jgi:hypothetical protein